MQSYHSCPTPVKNDEKNAVLNIIHKEIWPFKSKAGRKWREKHSFEHTTWWNLTIHVRRRSKMMRKTQFWTHYKVKSDHSSPTPFKNDEKNAVLNTLRDEIWPFMTDTGQKWRENAVSNIIHDEIWPFKSDTGQKWRENTVLNIIHEEIWPFMSDAGQKWREKHSFEHTTWWNLTIQVRSRSKMTRETQFWS